ncbi:hypothetical protein FB451DRAFT_1188740 [Mycena latifolia]|nr:hypothetical protein FB451DRAFT_1188740 [Mycena latifolia]
MSSGASRWRTRLAPLAHKVDDGRQAQLRQNDQRPMMEMRYPTYYHGRDAYHGAARRRVPKERGWSDIAGESGGAQAGSDAKKDTKNGGRREVRLPRSPTTVYHVLPAAGTTNSASPSVTLGDSADAGFTLWVHGMRRAQPSLSITPSPETYTLAGSIKVVERFISLPLDDTAGKGRRMWIPHAQYACVLQVKAKSWLDPRGTLFSAELVKSRSDANIFKYLKHFRVVTIAKAIQRNELYYEKCLRDVYRVWSFLSSVVTVNVYQVREILKHLDTNQLHDTDDAREIGPSHYCEEVWAQAPQTYSTKAMININRVRQSRPGSSKCGAYGTFQRHIKGTFGTLCADIWGSSAHDSATAGTNETSSPSQDTGSGAEFRRIWALIKCFELMQSSILVHVSRVGVHHIPNPWPTTEFGRNLIEDWEEFQEGNVHNAWKRLAAITEQAKNSGHHPGNASNILPIMH